MIVDLYLSGYLLGHQHALYNQRRRPQWELRLRTWRLWIPIIYSVPSYLDGYSIGFHDGVQLRMARIQHHLSPCQW